MAAKYVQIPLPRAENSHLRFSTTRTQNSKRFSIASVNAVSIENKLYFEEKIRRMTRHSLTNLPEFNKQTSYDIGLEGLSQIMDSSRSIVVRFIWILVILICFSICTFQFCKCVATYLEEPIAVDVEIREAETLQFPSITISNAESQGLYDVWKEAQGENESMPLGVESCLVPVRVVISAAYGIDTKMMWRRLNTTSTLKDLKLDARGKTYSVDVIEKAGIMGLQSQVQTDKMFPYGGILTKYVCTIEKIPDGCRNTQLVGSIQPYGMPSDLRTTMAFTSLLYFDIIFTMQKYEFVSRRASPCVSPEQNSKCRAQCAIKAFKDFPCRFPFLPPEVILPPCKTGGKNMSTLYTDTMVMFARMPCLCPRLCQDSSFRVAINVYGQSKTKTVLSAYFQNNIMTVIKERFSYDLISLLSDIGGNLGLCLGFSILSIFQFLQGLWKIARSRSSKNRKSTQGQLFRADPIVCQVNRILRDEFKHLHSQQIQTTEADLPIVGLSTVVNTNAPPALRVVWICVILSCFLGYCAFGYVRITSYLSEPTLVEVNVTKADVVQFPNITICGIGFSGIQFFRRLAKKQKKYWKHVNSKPIYNWCQLQLIDLLQIPGMNAQTAWNSMSVFEEFDRAWDIGEFLAGFQFLKNVTWRPVYMPEGRCIEYFIGNQQYAGSNTMFSRITMTKVDDLFHQELLDCDRSHLTVYLTPPNTNLHLNQRILCPKKMKSMLMMESSKVKLLNLRRKPCVDPSVANECSTRCFQEMLFNQVSCRLPYMPDFANLTFCSNMEEGRAAHDTYIYLAATLDAVKHPNCSCLPTCETIMINTVVHNEPLDLMGMTILGNLFFTNIEQHMVEVHADSLSKLLCDLGGNLGLALGVSLLSVFDMIQTLLAGFFHCVWRSYSSQQKRIVITIANPGLQPVKPETTYIPNTPSHHSCTLMSNKKSFHTFEPTTAFAYVSIKKSSAFY